MKFNEFFEFLDKSICGYLGLKKDNTKPETVELIDNELVVTYTDGFKRHLYKNGITQLDLKKISYEDKEKLGVAAGKAIAKNLVISFEIPPDSKTSS